MRIETAIKEYLLEIEVRRYSPRTARSYRNDLNLFLRFCIERAKIENVEDTTLGTVKAYLLRQLDFRDFIRIEKQRFPHITVMPPL